MKRPFTRSARGITARLGVEERQVLRLLPDLLDSVGVAGGDDPAANRLRPAAHLDDAAAEAEFQMMIGEQLDDARRGDRGAFAASLDRDPVTLNDEEADAWLRVLGEARLVLATRMGIVDDYDWGDAELASRPDGAMLQYLSHLQDGLVAAVSRNLPRR